MLLMITNTFGAAFMSRLLLQSKPIVEMADKLRDNGKIYVVVAVLLIILLGIVAYLISLDRKISKLEQDDKS